MWYWHHTFLYFFPRASLPFYEHIYNGYLQVFFCESWHLALVGSFDASFLFQCMGPTFLFLSMPCNFLLETGYFKWYSVATLGISPPLQILLLLFACLFLVNGWTVFSEVYFLHIQRSASDVLPQIGSAWGIFTVLVELSFSLSLTTAGC